MVDIYIEDSNSAQLVGSPVKHWLIFTLPPDTFLLILNPHLSRNEAQIGLAYSGEIFQCTFSRHSHLNYVAKLIELFKVLDLPVDRQLTEEWLVLYEIHDFESRRSGYSLKVVTPIYGKEVIVKSWHSQSVQLISNCYRLSQKTFYFLDGEDQRDEQPLSLVINTTGREIYGVFLKVGEVKVCVPFQIVLSEKECELRISPDILPSLYLTCYVEFQSSFCTGIMISKLKLLSAKHLIPPRGQKRGTFVNVRQYPYQKTQRGTVSRVGPEQLDIIEICLSDSEPTSGQLENDIDNEKNLGINGSRDNHNGHDYQIATQIRAIGFGKYSFSKHVLQSCERILPTVHLGVISKVVMHDQLTIFVKTDASLFNGFSGCGIWDKERAGRFVGMAVFILKHKHSLLSYHKQNFSYSSEFIAHMLRDSHDDELVHNQDGWLKLFDNIETRKDIRIVKPRL